MAPPWRSATWTRPAASSITRPGSSPACNITVAATVRADKSTTYTRSRSGSAATAICPSDSTRSVPPLTAGGATAAVTIAPGLGRLGMPRARRHRGRQAPPSAEHELVPARPPGPTAVPPVPARPMAVPPVPAPPSALPPTGGMTMPPGPPSTWPLPTFEPVLPVPPEAVAPVRRRSVRRPGCRHTPPAVVKRKPRRPPSPRDRPHTTSTAPSCPNGATTVEYRFTNPPGTSGRNDCLPDEQAAFGSLAPRSPLGGHMGFWHPRRHRPRDQQFGDRGVRWRVGHGRANASGRDADAVGRAHRRARRADGRAGAARRSWTATRRTRAASSSG